MSAPALLLSKLRCWPLALVGMLLLLLPAFGQAEEVSVAFAQGTHVFRRILYDLHLQPLQQLEQLRTEPSTKLLIVLGETEFLARASPRLVDFVERGGAVLLATDRRCLWTLPVFGAGITGDAVSVRPSSKAAYKERGDCIFIRDNSQTIPLFEDLAQENDLSRVATNRPSYLIHEPGGPLQVLARFPPESRVGNRRPSPNLPFAAGGRFGAGRLLILADHSVFINAMMWQPDLDNFDFAYNCVNWLTDKGERHQVLFLEEGHVQQNFAIPLKEPPRPPLPSLQALVETVDHSIGALEKENMANAAIHQAVEKFAWPPERWLQGVVLTATLGLAMLGLARLTQARQRREKAIPGALPPRGVRSSPILFEERHESMLQNGNVWEAARALARQAFEGETPPELDGSAAVVPAFPPPVSRWRNWRLRRRISRLWRLAYGAEPMRVSVPQLRRLGSEIEKLRSLLTRLAPPAGPRP